MDKELAKIVHNSIFVRQTRKIDEIYRYAKKKGFNVTRNEIYKVVEAVCTPYKKGK